MAKKNYIKEDAKEQYPAYTKAFWTRQKFGAASDVRSISVEEYMKEKPPAKAGGKS
jgi:hypothetical protein